MLIRRETPADVAAIRRVHTAAFGAGPEGSAGSLPAEAALVDELRADPGWLPALSLVAVRPADRDGEEAEVVGHVVGTRATVRSPAVRDQLGSGDHPAVGLGPVGVVPSFQGRGVGSALMHAVLAAADALDEPVVVLLGHADYYPRFGFRPASGYGIDPPVAAWAGPHFQARPLAAYRPEIRGEFRYAAPFDRL